MKIAYVTPTMEVVSVLCKPFLQLSPQAANSGLDPQRSPEVDFGW